MRSHRGKFIKIFGKKKETQKPQTLLEHHNLPASTKHKTLLIRCKKPMYSPRHVSPYRMCSKLRPPPVLRPMKSAAENQKGFHLNCVVTCMCVCHGTGKLHPGISWFLILITLNMNCSIIEIFQSMVWEAVPWL